MKKYRGKDQRDLHARAALRSVQLNALLFGGGSSQSGSPSDPLLATSMVAATTLTIKIPRGFGE